MKHPLPAFLLVATVLVSGCSSLDNPFAGWFGTGRDARVYNAQTGEFEWPRDGSKPRPRKPGAAITSGDAPAAERKGDGRYFDAVKNQWVEAPGENAAAPRAKARPSSPAVAAVVAPPPIATPPPPPPARASGIYNPSTGQIEWRDYAPAPAPAAPPARRKNWWWPF